MDFAAPRTRRLERRARDALDLELAVVHRVVRAHAGRAARGRTFHVHFARPRAEVQTAGEFAHDEHVHALEVLGLEARGVLERVEDAHRPQVGVQAERLADAEEALLGTRLGRIGGVPLGSADGRQQHRVGSMRDGERGFGKRGSGCIDSRPAEKRLGELEAHAVALADDAEDLHGLGGDLRADAIARQQADAIRGHEQPPSNV